MHTVLTRPCGCLLFVDGPLSFFPVAVPYHPTSPLVPFSDPRDDTPGCTIEAQGFRDAADRLAAAGAVVVGVSGDSVESHDAFKAKYGLNFALASDEAKSMLEAYGVWQLRQKFGKEFMGVVRSTFVIDAEGVVAREWLGVTVDGHVEEVVSYVEGM